MAKKTRFPGYVRAWIEAWVHYWRKPWYNEILKGYDNKTDKAPRTG